MAHTVDFHRRLELDTPTITAMDLLLTKLQIHEFTANDLIDCIVLLAEHDLGTNAPRVINDSYIADIMRKDWGFYYTAKANLKKVADSLTGLPGASRECSRQRAGPSQRASQRPLGTR